MSSLDRLARWLAPYAGLFTVATCGSPPDCPPSTDHVTVRLAVTVEGTIAVDSSLDGRLAAPFTRDAPIVDGVWRCESHVTGGGERARSDTAVIALPSNLDVSCVRSVGTESRLVSFSLPLGDLREPSVVGERTAPVSISLSDIGKAPSSCSATLDAAVRVDSMRAQGASAPGPEHVTADFVRELAVVVRLDGETLSSTTDRPCAAQLKGEISLQTRLDAKSFPEAATDSCL